MKVRLPVWHRCLARHALLVASPATLLKLYIAVAAQFPVSHRCPPCSRPIDAGLSSSNAARLIALQIKSGRSYFDEGNPDKYVYRGSLRHLDYWPKHSLPVVLILYDPTRDSAWWCWVSEAAGLVRLEKGWSVCVPRNQQLGVKATLALKSIAMPNPLNHARLQEIASRYSQERSYRRLPAILDALHAAEESIDVISPFLDETLFLALVFCSHRVRVRLLTGPEVPASTVKEFQTGDHERIEWKMRVGCHAKLIAAPPVFLDTDLG